MPPPSRVPVRIDAGWVEWLDVGTLRFTDPFFENTVRRAGRRAERWTQPLESLTGIAPGPGPAGLIFHVSRCGSTLISQMLSTAGQLVLSEPPPVDGIFRLHHAGVFS